MTLTPKQKIELAENYMKKHSVSFGSRDADDRAIEMYISGLDYREELHEEMKKEFKTAFIELYKFHANEVLNKFLL